MAADLSGTCDECGAEIDGGSAACHELMFELTARSPDARRLIVRRDLVDAYALQHPASQCESERDVAAHLLNLCCSIECNGSLDLYSGIKTWLRRTREIPDLVPPSDRGDMTILDAAAADELETHIEIVRQWAACVWQAWQPHHDTVRGWIEQIRATR